MAPADTIVVCAFGDSITDGTHSTLNTNDRWANVLSRRLHKAYRSRISVVNEAITGNRVVNPVVANSAAGPAAVDRLDRDVLGLSGLIHVIWLEGINDVGAGHTTAAIIAGYQDIVGRLHTKGIRVFGGTMTSALGAINPSEGGIPVMPGAPITARPSTPTARFSISSSARRVCTTQSSISMRRRSIRRPAT